MLTSDFDYELPPELIAQVPAPERARWEAGAMAERPRPQTTTLVAVGCLLAAAAVAVVWWLGEDDTEAEFCTATAAVDPPSASDPDAAFAAWFDDQGEEVSEHWRTTADADVQNDHLRLQARENRRLLRPRIFERVAVPQSQSERRAQREIAPQRRLRAP